MTSLVGEAARDTIGSEAARAALVTSPEWLAARRRAAWDAFGSLPMPSSQRDEDWRRTDVSALHLERFARADTVSASIIAAMREQRDSAAPDAVFVLDAPGDEAALQHADALQAQGVILSSLEEAATRHPGLVRDALSRVAVDESKFTALWNAMWRGGVFVHVPAGIDAIVPVWVAHAASGAGGAFFPATVASLERGAGLTLVDAYASPAGAEELFSDSVTLLSLERDARLDYIVLQQLGDGAWHVATHRAELATNARLRFFGTTLGAKLQKSYWEAILQGTGAEADIAGICFGDGKQHLDHQSLQAHVGAETRSNLLLKVAVRDQARSVYSGLIDVAPSAVHADGYVQNRNLLLSHGAKADSVPRLEIRANDVRCGHGATAGHIDDEQRFYFMSRGVTREQADALIVRGFMDDVLDRVPLEGLRTLLSELLDAEIAGLTQAGLGAGAL